MKYILLLLTLNQVFSLLMFGQKQNNSPSSDCFADVPHRVNVISDTVIPVSVYIHESECIGCINYLASVDISLKGASQTSYGASLKYNSLSHSDFMQMFSEFSENDPANNKQSFIDALPERSNNHTLIFTADTNWWIPPVPNVAVDSRYFYFTINIPKDDWLTFINEEAIDISVIIGIDLDTDEEFYFRVFTTDQDFPSVPECYYGDVHYHSIYTQDLAENGMPLTQTKRAAKYLGLDWTVITDHSCDFDNYGNSMSDNWDKLGNEIQVLNQEDSSFVFIRGMEASVQNGSGYLIHALAYPDPDHPFGLPYVCDGNGDLTPTTMTLTMLLDSLDKYNGFCYGSHPFSEGDALPSLMNGGIWNVNDSLYPENGEPCPPIGNVIWNDLSGPSDIYSNLAGKLFRNNLAGGELLNLSNYLTCDDNDTDPWDTQNNGNTGFTGVDPNDVLAYRLDQNLNTYSYLLIRSLMEKNLNPSLENWKFFMSGGTDAHGSFNYSTTEYVWGGVSGRMTENAVGTSFTIAYCDSGIDAGGKYVLKALENGHTAISNGPALKMKIITPGGILIPGDFADISIYQPGDIIIDFTAASNNDLGYLSDVTVIITTGTSGEAIPVDYNISSGSFQISLDSLAADIWGTSYPENEYICIRSVITTSKFYSPSEELIRKTSSRNFFCMTNPVYLKIGTLVKAKNLLAEKTVLKPNPADNYLTVSSEHDLTDPAITVTGVTGSIYKYSLEGTGKNFIVNTSQLPEGHYILTINDNHVVSHARFIVIHK